MKVVGLVALGVVAMAVAGFGYEPPKLLAEIESNWPCTDFTCVGDQNGDGCDDLLIGNGWWQDGNGDREFFNTVELYYGGEEMDDTPDFSIYGPKLGPLQIGERVNFVGHLTASDNPWWAIQIMTFDTSYDYPYTWTYEVWLYEAGAALDTIPEFKLCPDQGDGIKIGYGRNIRPTDVNGDGSDDLITLFYDRDTLYQMRVYFGGEEFDTLPDWETTLPGLDISSGYDVNGDGYDDILTQSSEQQPDLEYTNVYSLFLGGDPMDTTRVFALEQRQFAPKSMQFGVTMLQDVNDDGYDDWAIQWFDNSIPDPYDHEGYFIFYGRPEPDAEPDLSLPGAHYAWGADGYVTGGDFNGDGVGDIVTMNIGGWTGSGEMFIHLGSRWFDNQPELDVKLTDQYGVEFGRRVGGTGDYDGDGVDDWVAGSYASAISPYFVLCGNRDWRVGVSEEIAPERFDLQLTLWPNPFNGFAVARYEVRGASSVSLKLYDLSGELVQTLFEGWQEAGAHQAVIDGTSLASGVYLLRLAAGRDTVVRKVVCVK